jgi:hypothetical protein
MATGSDPFPMSPTRRDRQTRLPCDGGLDACCIWEPCWRRNSGKRLAGASRLHPPSLPGIGPRSAVFCRWRRAVAVRLQRGLLQGPAPVFIHEPVVQVIQFNVISGRKQGVQFRPDVLVLPQNPSFASVRSEMLGEHPDALALLAVSAGGAEHLRAKAAISAGKEIGVLGRAHVRNATDFERRGLLRQIRALPGLFDEP